MTGSGAERVRGSRRGLILGGLALAGGYAGLRAGLPALRDRFGALDFEPLNKPPGFRRMAGGEVSQRGFDPFLGLDASPEDTAPPATAIGDDLCAALFGDGARAPDVVPIAYFSDYNCTYCRALSPRLAAMARDRAGEVAIAWHELPLLGPTSLTAARAIVAAGAQGAGQAFHEALMTSRLGVTPDSLDALSRRLGIDPERLEADMTAPSTERVLGRSRALSNLFGFIGTPALVVGRTVVVGAISETALDRLIARERADGPVPACR